MGLSSEALWRLTQREFEALSDRYLSFNRHLDEMQARNAALLWNMAHPQQDSLDVADFMPDGRPARDPEKEKLYSAKAARIAGSMMRPLREDEIPDWAKFRPGEKAQ